MKNSGFLSCVTTQYCTICPANIRLLFLGEILRTGAGHSIWLVEIGVLCKTIGGYSLSLKDKWWGGRRTKMITCIQIYCGRGNISWYLVLFLHRWIYLIIVGHMWWFWSSCCSTACYLLKCLEKKNTLYSLLECVGSAWYKLESSHLIPTKWISFWK